AIKAGIVQAEQVRGAFFAVAAADALQQGGDVGGNADQDDAIDAADIDAELQGHGGDADGGRRVQEGRFGVQADAAREAAVVGKDVAAQSFARAQVADDFFDGAAGVGKDDDFSAGRFGK